MKKILISCIYLGVLFWIGVEAKSIYPLLFGLVSLFIWLFVMSMKKDRQRERKANENIEKLEKQFINRAFFIINENYILSFNDEGNFFETFYSHNDLRKVDIKDFDILPLKSINFARENETLTTQLNSNTGTNSKEINKFYITLVFENGSSAKVMLKDIVWNSFGKIAIKFEEFYMNNLAKIKKK